MDSTTTMIALSDGTAITQDDYNRIFSAAAADSQTIESMELSLYRTRMATEALTQSINGTSQRTTSETTGRHDEATPLPAVSIAQTPGGDVLVRMPAQAQDDDDDADATTNLPKIDDTDLDIDVQLPMTSDRNGMDGEPITFAPSDAYDPLPSGTFTYTPPESYVRASEAVTTSLPVIGSGSGFVSEITVLESMKPGRRHKRRRA